MESPLDPWHGGGHTPLSNGGIRPTTNGGIPRKEPTEYKNNGLNHDKMADTNGEIKNGGTNGTHQALPPQPANGGNGLITMGTLDKKNSGDGWVSGDLAPARTGCCERHSREMADHYYDDECDDGYDDDERDYVCGLWSVRPKWLQPFANKKAFLAVFCLTSVLQVGILNCACLLNWVKIIHNLMSCNKLGTVAYLSHCGFEISVLYGNDCILDGLQYIYIGIFDP